MRRIEELVPKIISAELGEERGVDLLKRKVEYLRKQSSRDPLEQTELAEVLVKYARTLLKDDDSEAKSCVKEAISIYESYLQKWDSDSIRAELETAKELLATLKERIAALCHTDFSQIVSTILSNEVQANFIPRYGPVE